MCPSLCAQLPLRLCVAVDPRRRCPLPLPARCSAAMSVPLSVRSGGLLSSGAAASDDFDGEEADKHVNVQVRLQDVTVS